MKEFDEESRLLLSSSYCTKYCKKQQTNKNHYIATRSSDKILIVNYSTLTFDSRYCTTVGVVRSIAQPARQNILRCKRYEDGQFNSRSNLKLSTLGIIIS